MLRRSLLTAAIAAPSLYAAKALAYPYEFEDCGCTPSWPENVWDWSEDMRQQKTYEGRGYGLGTLALPPGAFVVGSRTDPIYRAQFTPGQFADEGDLANMFGVGGGGGTLAGGYVAGGRGMILGGLYGLGAGLAFWVGWNIGTAIYIATTSGWNIIVVKKG